MPDDAATTGRCACCRHFNGKHLSSSWQDTYGECGQGKLGPERRPLSAEDTCGLFELARDLPDDLARLHAEGYPARPSWWVYL